MLKDGRHSLRRNVDWPDEVTLTPYSGVQILDFGFCLEDVAFKAKRFIERVSAQADDAQTPERCRCCA
jgi:hypothetical protein